MQQNRILWADDEIDLLKAHILFLSNKGYEVTPVNSGSDALEKIDHESFDIVFLDENMPGMSGLEALSYIKSTHPNLPVVMITKNEEEHIMEEAIGSKIADYLIKPLNPNQILSSVKKILDNERLITEAINYNYQQEFTKLSMELGEVDDHDGWVDLYKKLVFWELEIDRTDEKTMNEVLQMQKADANRQFSQFIAKNYESWLADQDGPVRSDQILKKYVLPLIGEEPVFLIVIDNLRLDQWKVIEPDISKIFDFQLESQYYSILPTTTAYARNSLFSGLLPLEITKQYPNFWVGEADEGSKNNFESELLASLLEREGIGIKHSYHKIIKAQDGKHLRDNVKSLLDNPLNAIVYNFVDMLSHARTDMQMIKQLAPNESAYRSLTKTWFDHSSLYDTLKRLAEHKVKIVITTDHGTIRVNRPEKIVGDRNTNSNLRYKLGKNLSFDERSVVHAANPESLHLPRVNISSSYVFAKEDSFFAYPNNYNYYVNYFKDTFQHGGISLEEMIIPFIVMTPK